MNDKTKSLTVQYYDQNPDDWSATHGGNEDFSWWKDEMQKFKKFLPNGKVIEFGAGAGKDAKTLISLGYEYLGTDASVGLLKLAKERNPGTKFIQKYIHELEPSIGQFDGFWASAVLLHIPREEIVDSLKSISSIIKPNGVGFITLKEGEGNRIDKDTGRLFTYFKEEEFREYLFETGFTTLDVDYRKTPKENWLIFYVQKRQN